MNEFKEDVAYQEFINILPELKSLTKQENESTTRLRVIDTILFELLNWDKNQVETEKYCRQEGYADYLFLINNNPCLILESKRSGIDFVIPNRKFSDRPFAFGLFSKECPDAFKAFQQAIGYAATLGARYIAISNGHQWLFSLTYVQSQPLEKRLIYIFESFDAITERFSLFCKCFSANGLQLNQVSKYLLDDLRQPAPSKLSSKVPGYPKPANRNIFQNEIAYILDYVWQVMSHDEETITFVKNCYVNPNSHEDIISLVKELIDKRKNEDEIIREYEIESVDKLPPEIASLPSEKPFIILGEVGRGKSSFLKYLRYVGAEQALKNYIQIEINFLDRPDNPGDIPDFVHNEIEQQLRDNYNIDIYENKNVRGILHSDLQRLKTTPKGVHYSDDKTKYCEFELAEIEKITSDKHLYFTKVIYHLKQGRNCSIALFFDNLDRRSLEIQEKAFLKASAIARDWASLVFICLRPSTYYHSQRNGVLDTIAPTTFTVGQPDLSLVLKKRFAYAKKIAEGVSLDKNLFRSVPSKNVSLVLPSVAKIFESCEFAARKRHGIIPMLEDVSNGNIRRLLDFAKRILSSGHLDTKKILGKIEEGGKYIIPDYEGVKVLLYGDYMNYDPSISPFINLFDIQNNDPAEHFIRIAILNYLVKIPFDSASYGYAKTSDVLNYLSILGYSYNITETAINYLIERNCASRPIEKFVESIETDKMRITALGRYHIFSLVFVFQYFDAIIIDTPLLDDNLRSLIIDETDIVARLERTQKFINYLDLYSENIKDQELKSLWDKIQKEAIKNIREIREKNKTLPNRTLD